MMAQSASAGPVPGPSTSICPCPSQHQQLVQMAKQPLVFNPEPSECYLCHRLTPTGSGVVLVNCLHTFCLGCLTRSLLDSKTGTVQCPYPSGKYECDGTLEDHEVEALLGPTNYRKFLQRQFDALQLDNTVREPQAALLPADLELLVTLTDASVVPNPEAFECPVCFGAFEAYEGVILRDCFHSFCRDCLANSVKHADDVVVRCPFQNGDVSCESVIQDREIRSLLSEDDYGKYLARSLRKAESLAENAFHCKTPNCTGWCVVDANVSHFSCPVCLKINCLKCKAIHDNMDCEEYQDRLSGNYENRRSERAMQNLIDVGDAMRCPRCTAVVQKISGCDSVTCTLCKTMICWITRGPRWGPGGPGDTSGGCRCNVGGRKCHPSCRNCH